MKFSTVVENEELCISALHESSGNFWMSSVVLDLAFFILKGPFVFLATSIFYYLSCRYVIIPAEIFDICRSTCSSFNSQKICLIDA